MNKDIIDSPPEPERRDRPLSNQLIALYLSAFLLMLTLLYAFTNSIGINELRLMIAGGGLWGPLIYVGIKALTFTFAPLSAGPIQFASGLLFGVIPGTFYSLLGETLGGAANLLIARIVGRRIVRRFVGDTAMQRIDDMGERYLEDWRSLFVARLLLFSVYDFISYAVGFGKIRLSRYLFASFVGGLLPTYVFVLIGSQAAQNEDVLLVMYVGAALLFVALLIFRGPITKLINWFQDMI